MTSRSPRRSPVPLVLLLRLGLATLFLYAGVAKLDALRLFTADVVRLQLVPFRWAEWAAASLAMAELFTGVWLLSGWRLRAAALAAGVLAGIFALAVAQAMARGLGFDCHCFGQATEPPKAGFVLIRAAGLLAAAAVLRRRAGAAGGDVGLRFNRGRASVRR